MNWIKEPPKTFTLTRRRARPLEFIESSARTPKANGADNLSNWNYSEGEDKLAYGWLEHKHRRFREVVDIRARRTASHGGSSHTVLL